MTTKPKTEGKIALKEWTLTNVDDFLEIITEGLNDKLKSWAIETAADALRIALDEDAVMWIGPFEYDEGPLRVEVVFESFSPSEYGEEKLYISSTIQELVDDHIEHYSHSEYGDEGKKYLVKLLNELGAAFMKVNERLKQYGNSAADAGRVG